MEIVSLGRNKGKKQQKIADYNKSSGQQFKNAAKGAVPEKKFVFFAAFDGTNNHKDAKQTKDEPYSTNVAQLWDQYFEKMEQRKSNKEKANPQLHGGYYAGLGTTGNFWTNWWETWLSSAVTDGVKFAAQSAYHNFQSEACKWLEKKPNKSVKAVTVVLTGFSRGVASAAMFSQLLYKEGLNHPTTNLPIEVEVCAGILFDPVATGVSGNLAFPPNVKNIVVIKALSEFRHTFKAMDYTKQANATTVGMFGNHCDIGGGYDNGLGWISLSAATAFLREAGLPIADILKRKFKLDDISIHNEAKSGETVEEEDVWSSYDTFSYHNQVDSVDTKAWKDLRLFDRNITLRSFTEKWLQTEG